VARSFDVSTASPATVDQVQAAFASRDYWRDRLAEYGGESIRLDSLEVDGGAVSVRTIQDMRSNALPVVIAKVVPGDLLVMRSEIWQVRGDELHGEVVITARGAPISGNATAVVAPASDGSTLRFCGSVQAKVPLIGGQIEKYIGSQITDEIPGVQRFTSRWIAENG
jgi:hypothetical protein